ncbi:MAG: hypothetical protein KF754_08105 [Planctomycetes bacterium]|nr:hypothetical protein [Planctomycetota bacterium]
MAFMEVVPYVAYAGAGLLAAFVGGEYALKKWKARSVKSAAPVVPEDSGRGLVSRPAPLSVRKAPAPEVVAEVISEVEIPVAQAAGSSNRMQVFDESESVRIAEVAMLHVSDGESGRFPELLPESGRQVPVHMAAEVYVAEQVAPEEYEAQAEYEDAPGYISGADTERCPAVGTQAVLAAAQADAGEMDVEGVLCTDVIAPRRDPSVRVFDAVVAPSERKSSAA